MDKYFVLRTHSHTDRQQLWKVTSRQITELHNAKTWQGYMESMEKNKEHKYFIVKKIDQEAEEKSINMILHCPKCHKQHIDEPDEKNGWNNPSHKSHLCLFCGEIWRPADVYTNGVKTIQTKGKKDTI